MYGYSGIYHDNLMKRLIDSVRRGQNSHAYIFEGARGLGKTNCAKLFAAALTCTGETAPCGKCPSCIQAKADTNPDITHITLPKDRKTIGVEQIREIVSDAYIKPFEAPRKVYIIHHGDALTEQAQNSFLKILEEPPSYAVFIIIATSSAPLLQTVLSRSVLIRFAELCESDMLKYISEKYPGEAERAPFLAKYSRGVPAAADEVIASEKFQPLRLSAFSVLDLLLSQKKIDAYDVVDFLELNKADADLVLDFWSDFLRDMLFVRCAATESIINSDMVSEIERKSANVSDITIVKALEAIIHMRELLRRYINFRAAALNLALKVKEE